MVFLAENGFLARHTPFDVPGMLLREVPRAVENSDLQVSPVCLATAAIYNALLVATVSASFRKV
jgi:hypothetical protein